MPDFQSIVRQRLRNTQIAPEDLVSVEDLAASIVAVMQTGWSTERSDWADLADYLSCLLKPVEEELLPPDGPTDWRIWEIFAGAHMQRKQFCLIAEYATWDNFNRVRQAPLIVTACKKLRDLGQSFAKVYLQLVKHTHTSSEFLTILTEFMAELNSIIDLTVGCTTGRTCTYLDVEDSPRASAVPVSVLLEKDWSKLADKASTIANEVQVAKMLTYVQRGASSDSSSRCSWSLVSSIPSNQAAGASEVESVASCHSLDSQNSYISGHGGSHCYMPWHLFKVFHSGFPSAPFVSAQDRVKAC